MLVWYVRGPGGDDKVLLGGEELEVTKMALLAQLSSPSLHSPYRAKGSIYYSMSGCKMVLYVLLYIYFVLGIYNSIVYKLTTNCLLCTEKNTNFCARTGVNTGETRRHWSKTV